MVDVVFFLLFFGLGGYAGWMLRETQSRRRRKSQRRPGAQTA